MEALKELQAVSMPIQITKRPATEVERLPLAGGRTSRSAQSHKKRSLKRVARSVEGMASGGGGSPNCRLRDPPRVEGLAAAGKALQAVEETDSMRSGKSDPTHFSQTQKRSRDLNGSIVSCEGCDQLLEILEREFESFSLINSVTALLRIAKFLKRMQSPQKEWRRLLQKFPTLTRLVESIDEEIPRLGGQGVCNVACAVIALPWVGSPRFWEKLERRFVERLPRMSGLEASATLMSLGKAGQLSKTAFQRIQPHLITWLERQQSMSLRSINGIIWVYAKMGLAVGYRDKGMEVRLCGMVKVHIQTRPSLQRELANLAWSVAKLEVQDPLLFDMLAQKVHDLLTQSQNQKIEDPRILTQAGHDLANFSWAFGRAFGSMISWPTDGRKDAYMHDHLSRVPARQLVFEKIVEMIPIVEGHLWPQGVSAILCGFANVRFYNEPILDRLSAKILADCNTYSMQAVSVIFWAISSLHYDTPATFEALAARALDLLETEEGYNQADEKAMVMLLFGCAIMNALHLPHCARLVQVIRGWLASGTVGKLTTAHSLSNVAWGLACLDLLDQQTLRKLFLQLAQIKNLDMQVLSKLYMADMAVRHSPGGGNSGGTTDVLLFLEECFNLGQIKMASTLMWTNITRRNSQNISSLHRNVAKAVEEVGGHFQLELMIDGFPLDIVMSGQRIAIEVNGPFHYTTNTCRPLGYHILKDRLLRQQGWNVIHVPYFEWHGMETRLEKREYITAALYQAGWKGPAAEPPLLGNTESGKAQTAGKTESDPRQYSVRGEDRDEFEFGPAESIADIIDILKDGGMDDLRERERRLALLPLDRKAGAKSNLLQRQAEARRRR